MSEQRSTAIVECPEHGDLCGGADCCCADLHVGPTWKDAHDALSAYVTTLVTSMSAESRDDAFARYVALRDALTDAENGS